LRIVLVAIALSSSAHARQPAYIIEPDRPRDDEPEEESPGAWYGWQIALSDAFSGGLVYWGLEADRAALLYGGLSTFIVIPPAIHGLHDRGPNGGAVLASLGTRVLVPLFMFLSRLGGRDEDGGTGFDLEADDQPQPSYGLMLLVSTVDIAVWSVPAVWSPPKKREDRRRLATLRPRISLHPDRALLSVGGIF
jgi:hypothetical protein